MDYIPVYEGEDDGGSVVKVSPGKLQRTGVRSEVVERRAVGRLVRVPGTVQLDERRISVGRNAERCLRQRGRERHDRRPGDKGSAAPPALFT